MIRNVLSLAVVALLTSCGGSDGSDGVLSANTNPPPVVVSPPVVPPPVKDVPVQIISVEGEIPADAIVVMQYKTGSPVAWYVAWDTFSGRQARMWTDPTIPHWPWTNAWSRNLGPDGYPFRNSIVTYDPITKVLSIPGYCKILILVGPA